MKLLILLLAIVIAPLSALAQDSPAANDAYKAIITHQLQAIAQDDGASAYAEAAPNVQKIFPSPEVFMNMVRGGYPQVYRNKQFSFGDSGIDGAGRPFQKVEILGMDGVRYEGIYFMERQPDGTWKISGVVMGQVEGSDA